MEKQRLDTLLSLKEGISRSQATELIKTGQVLINQKSVCKPSTLVGESDEVVVLSSRAFVSRAGEKLDYALKNFHLNVIDTYCLDVGASTGGFTQCLLQHQAKHVVALDVGTNQLHPSLKNHPQITSLEQTNIKDVSPADFKQLFDIITVDVSFISLEKILDATLALLKEDGTMILLIKPQFEVGKEHLNKHGVVTNDKASQLAIEKIQNLLIAKNKEVSQPLLAQPQGKSGNKEYFIFVKAKGNSC